MKHRLRRICIPLLLLTALAVYVWWGNTAVVTTEYVISDPDIPAEFSGFRMVQLSDLHFASLAPGSDALLAATAAANPDAILLTGDLIDSRHTDGDAALEFVARLTPLAPVYYVNGNHESRVPEDYERLKAGLTRLGVTILENACVTLTRGDAVIRLAGVNDPSFGDIQQALLSTFEGAEGYTVLLSHRPELGGYYAGVGADLVFTGHAHGGQFRLPLLGGLYAPHQGFLPTYESGLHRIQDTQMIVSRGIGNSAFPFRVNNRPEIVAVELRTGI